MGPEDHGPAGGRASYRYAQTRSALRRVIRSRRRRRWLLEAAVAVACLAAVASYLGTEQHPTPRREQSVLPAAPSGRPVLPSPGGPGVEGVAVTPGLHPRQRTPSPSPSPDPAPSTAPPAPSLAVSQADVPALVDLTAAGPTDWVHWGLLDSGAPVHKRRGSREIRDEGGRGRRVAYRNNPEEYAWQDGNPVGAARGTQAGVYTCGAGNGFSLSVAGDGRQRTVRLFAGLWMARARLDVRLSSGGPTRTLRLEDPHTARTAEFTVRFRAARGAKLLLSWTVERALGDCGNVSLQAVALR
ncbi:hypothetical protein [Micromonospora sp. NPDC050495]|uniref:hypothetical protein n=1 Tax=Micromonospora sp. NPDC050495 TaxID=3154936 RepID=UPI0033F47FB5